MLQIKNIKKEYKTGELIQKALDDVSLSLRDNEFVAVLGPSGSGKTTLLNVIGGLDRYDSGDLIINSISTRKYKDRDWDSYRNHTIGFVFQSYNLIPHQTILSNVELALTISGISRSERKKRAKKALEEVGLGNQLHKKPNQMSGGQMQRVAIARALVNNPDILLADEPTGALDSETSVQVMELLKKVAEDRLVVMVTHNPELAEQYATRIVRLKDGHITGDSDPYIPDETKTETLQNKNMGKSSMSFMTALSLSFNNLKTKKGRTLLTSFAGSIGIIGIALILSLSNGVNTYIENIQRETMTSYPISIEEQSIDLSSIMETGRERTQDSMEEADHDLDGVYSNGYMLEMASSVTSSISQNNLTEFKKYLDDPDSEIQQYIGENGIVYSYNTKFSVFTHDSEGTLVNTDGSTLDENSETLNSMGNMGMMSGMSSMTGTSTYNNFTEIIPGKDESLVSSAVIDNYDVVYGDWPQNYDEVVIVLDSKNEISSLDLYQLGFLPASEYKEIMDTIESGEEVSLSGVKLSYEDIAAQSFYLLPDSDRYQKNENGIYEQTGNTDDEIEALLENAIELHISGIVKLKEGSENLLITQTVGYTNALTEYLIEHANNSEVIKAQSETPETNVLTGTVFSPADDEAKIEEVHSYLNGLTTGEKAAIWREIMESMSYSDIAAMLEMSEYGNEMEAMGDLSESSEMTDEEMAAMMAAYGETATSAETISEDAAEPLEGQYTSELTEEETSEMMLEQSDNDLAAMMDSYIADADEEMLLGIYDTYIGNGSYDSNMTSFGYVNPEVPSGISIYTDSFENKERITECIDEYNKGASEEDTITYTDYIGLLMSSVTTIINVISYVLIAFVAVSLIVSSIMIGIITYISVLERTKEIGILRAIGASKRNISQVFNAETFIIGLGSGLMGVGIAALLLIPGNYVIHMVTESTDVNAILPVEGAVILIILSVILTLIGGLIPSKKAAKKDPVTALRTE